MYWNYRVVRRHNAEWEEDTFNIFEVYYDELDNITLWTVDPVAPQGSTIHELTEDLVFMMASLDKPVLDADDMPGIVVD